MVFPLFLLTVIPARGVDKLPIAIDGKSFLELNIFNPNDRLPPNYFGTELPNHSTFALSAAQQNALTEGVRYWGDMLNFKNNFAVPVLVRTDDAENATAYSPPLNTGYKLLQSALIGDWSNDEDDKDSYYALITIGSGLDYYLGPITSLPQNGDKFHLAATMAHEIGHAMGISSNHTFDEQFGELGVFDSHLYDSFGKDAKSNRDNIDYATTSTNGVFNLPDYAYFSGEKVSEVLKGATIAGRPAFYDGSPNPDTNPKVIAGYTNMIPINGFEGNDEYPELSHIELFRSMMSHQNYRNWGVFMEAELALLQDLGYDLDRSQMFGGSEYRSGLPDEFVPNLKWSSNAAHAIGYHIYGHGNEITFTDANLNASGFDGTGIRLESDWMGGSGQENIAGNILNLNNSTITANGNNGTGLLVSYGKGHSINSSNSVISASGENGIGVRFDFGDNMLGSTMFEYRGSYIRTIKEQNVTLLPELEGALVENFTVNDSTITGQNSAIYISSNAYVKEIDLKNGAVINGSIKSDWDVNNLLIQYVENPPLTTALTTNNATINGSIVGKSIDLVVDSGGAKYAAINPAARHNADEYYGINVGSYTQSGNLKITNLTTGNGAPLRIHADKVTYTVDSGGKIKIQDGNAGFKFDDTLFQITSSSTPTGGDWDDFFDTSRLSDFVGDAQIGFYDVNIAGLKSSVSDNGVAITSIVDSRRINEERAAVSAITSPLATAVFNPTLAILNQHLQNNFSDMYDRWHLPDRETAGSAATGSGGGNAPTAWMRGGYSWTPAGKYDLGFAPFALGFDWTFDRVFFGAAATTGFARYKSSAAKNNSTLYGGALYGGFRLPAEIKIGVSSLLNGVSYDQRRWVGSDEYAASYNGLNSATTFYAEKGIALEPIWLRPFVSYDLLTVKTDGFRESGSGLQALRYGEHLNVLHQVGGGLGATYELTRHLMFDGKVYGKAILGDRTSTPQITMYRAPTVTQWTQINGSSYEISPYITGLSLGWRGKVREFELGANYDLSVFGTRDVALGHTFSLTAGLNF